MHKIADMWIRPILIWLVPLVAVVGCATYRDRPLSASETLDDFHSRTLEAPVLQRYLQDKLDVQQWPPSAWNLPELTLAAFFYSPQLDVARARCAVIQGERQTAAERPNPTFGLTPGFNSTTGYGADISPWIVTTALDIPLETAGKRGYRIAEAEHLGQAARLQIAQSAWDVRQHVREALLDLYEASQTATLLRDRQAVQDDNVQLLEHMFELGEISANELEQARAQRDETRLALLDAEKQQAQARAALAGAIGIPAQALDGKVLSFDVFATLPASVPSAEAQRRALLNRADILAALAEYEASQSALQQEIAKQYPDVQIGPGYEFDQSDNKWMLGLSVTLPIFNQNQGAIATAKANRMEARTQFIALQARVIGDLAAAVNGYQAAIKKVQVAETLATERRAAARRTKQMYELGEIVRSQVDAADLDSNAAALNHLQARIEALRTQGQVEEAMHVAADLPDWSRQVSFGYTQCQRDQDHEE